MSMLVDLPGVVNPLEDDWWLFEGRVSGFLMDWLQQDVQIDKVAITEVTGGRWLAILCLTSSLVIMCCIRNV